MNNKGVKVPGFKQPRRDVTYGKTDPVSVGPRIRMLLPTLTPAERLVADWLLKRRNFTEAMTIGEAAQALEVSEPFLVKIARRLGYSGFKALRSDLLAYHNLPRGVLQQDLRRDDSVADIKSKIFHATCQVLEEVQSINAPEVIEEAAKVFFRAAHRDILGVGGSATVCHDAAHKFLRIGIRCSVISDAHLMLMSASLLSRKDVVLAVSHSGQTVDVLRAVRLARASGARIIALTNSYASDLAREADVTLCAPARDTPMVGQNATARIAQLTLIDNLFMCLARQDFDLAEANLKKTISAVAGLHQAAQRRSRERGEAEPDSGDDGAP